MLLLVCLPIARSGVHLNDIAMGKKNRDIPAPSTPPFSNSSLADPDTSEAAQSDVQTPQAPRKAAIPDPTPRTVARRHFFQQGPALATPTLVQQFEDAEQKATAARAERKTDVSPLRKINRDPERGWRHLGAFSTAEIWKLYDKLVLYNSIFTYKHLLFFRITIMGSLYIAKTPMSRSSTLDTLGTGRRTFVRGRSWPNGLQPPLRST